MQERAQSSRKKNEKKVRIFIQTTPIFWTQQKIISATFLHIIDSDLEKKDPLKVTQNLTFTAAFIFIPGLKWHILQKSE